MVNGKRHGDLARRIADEVKSRRRLDLGLEKPPVPPMSLPTHKSPEETRQHELGGGIVIVGRHTFKEFMAGLKRGWTDWLEKVDRDELLARELEADGHFDEPDELPQHPDEEMSTSSPHIPSSEHSPVYSPLRSIRQSYPPPVRANHQSQVTPYSQDGLPPIIPPLPPLLFVSFTNYIGFTLIPLMIWDFFNQRRKVRAGAEAAYRLIKADSRPFTSPPVIPDGHSSTDSVHAQNSYSDLDFDRQAESYYKKSLSSIPEDIEKARKKYYDSLPAKLETARAISRGTQEMPKDERDYPPTEVELRAERMKKEKRWRNDLEGWEIVKPEQDVTWDERFTNALRVFVDPGTDD